MNKGLYIHASDAYSRRPMLYIQSRELVSIFGQQSCGKSSGAYCPLLCIKYAKPIKNMWRLQRISSTDLNLKHILAYMSRDFVAIAFYFGIYARWKILRLNVCAT